MRKVILAVLEIKRAFSNKNLSKVRKSVLRMRQTCCATRAGYYVTHAVVRAPLLILTAPKLRLGAAEGVLGVACELSEKMRFDQQIMNQINYSLPLS